jgi:hypothetical protein
MNGDDDDDNYDDFDAHINQIVRRRMIPRRTNWRYRYMALSHDEELQLYVPNDNLIYDYYILN